jgi:hypothetical protein
MVAKIHWVSFAHLKCWVLEEKPRDRVCPLRKSTDQFNWENVFHVWAKAVP